MDNQSNGLPVLVVGATGFLGMQICKNLVEEKYKVKALVRKSSDPSKVETLERMGIETITGDIKDRASLDKAFTGVSKIISTASSTLSRQEGDSIESVDQDGQLNVVNAAKDANVEHLVFISVHDLPGDFPLQTAKRSVEQAIKESGITYTILQPTMFMEVWLGPALGFDYQNYEATVFGEGNNKLSWISIGDVANFAVHSLNIPETKNKIFLLGGPESLSPLEVVKIFENHSGKSFNVAHVPMEALEAQKASAPDSLTKSFASLSIGYATGFQIDMKQTMNVFSFPLTSVEEYAQRVMAADTAMA